MSNWTALIKVVIPSAGTEKYRKLLWWSLRETKINMNMVVLLLFPLGPVCMTAVMAQPNLNHQQPLTPATAG